MHRLLLIVSLTAILLAGCSSQAPASAQPTQSEIKPPPTVTEPPPTPTVDPNLILEEPHVFLPLDENIFAGYQRGNFYWVYNEIIGRDWGSEYEELLSGMGRITGCANFYTQQDWPDKITEYFILIEQFDSIQGAIDFYEYDFPAEFRNNAYEAEPTELGAAHQARVRRKMDLPDQPDNMVAFVEFRYNNMVVFVRGTGPSMGFPLAYTKRAASLVLDNLQNQK